MKDNNQAAFLNTIRQALGHPQNTSRQAPAHLFHTRPSERSRQLLARIQNREPAQRQILLDTLVEAAKPINLDVSVVPSPDEAADSIIRNILSAPVEWGGPRKVCMWDHPLIQRLGLHAKLAALDIPCLSSSTFIPTGDGPAPADQKERLRQAIIESFVGITSADFCVSETATLVQRTSPGQPRAISLVPSIHIAVITADQIVADFGELYASLRWSNAGDRMDLTTCMTFITGPSKTADIEATLVHGAHGPKAVWLYIINPRSGGSG